MDRFRFDKMLPTMVAQICFWAFFQKFVYGYTLQAHGTWRLFGWLTTDYFIAFPCLVLACALVFAAALARSGAFVRRPALVLAAGGAAAFACPAVLFGWGGAFGVIGQVVRVLASVALALALCVVLFAWMGRMQCQADELGVRTVLLSALAAYLVYCVIAPSYSNYTPYVLVLEVVSLPLAALAYAFAERSSARGSVETCASALREGRRGGLWCLAGVGVLCAVFLSASYVDFLCTDLPAEHMEQPTFYALLIFGVVLLAAALAWDDASVPLINGRTMVAAGVTLAFLAVSFMVVFYFAGASGRFCFDFTCALRRLVIIVGFVATLGIALTLGMRVDVSVACGFLMPFLGSRIVMRTLGLHVQAGVLAGSADERLACMLVLGCVGVIGLAIVAVVAHRSGAVCFGTDKGMVNVVPPVLPGAGGPRHAEAVQMLADSCVLSGRERQILHYLSLGYSVSRMSELLGISDNTVGTHVRSVYKKTGLHTKQEIIDRVVEVESRL